MSHSNLDKGDISVSANEHRSALFPK